MSYAVGNSDLSRDTLDRYLQLRKARFSGVAVTFARFVSPEIPHERKHGVDPLLVASRYFSNTSISSSPAPFFRTSKGFSSRNVAIAMAIESRMIALTKTGIITNA